MQEPIVRRSPAADADFFGWATVLHQIQTVGGADDLNTAAGKTRWDTKCSWLRMYLLFTLCISSSYHTVAGIYGIKQTKFESVAQGWGSFSSSCKFLVTCAITIIYPTWLVLCINTVSYITSLSCTHACTQLVGGVYVPMYTPYIMYCSVNIYGEIPDLLCRHTS